VVGIGSKQIGFVEKNLIIKKPLRAFNAFTALLAARAGSANRPSLNFLSVQTPRQPALVPPTLLTRGDNFFNLALLARNFSGS